MFISEESPLFIDHGLRSSAKAKPVQWDTFRHGVIPRLGFELMAGDLAVFPKTQGRPGDLCLLTIGLPPDALASNVRFEVRWRPAITHSRARKATETVLYRGCLPYVKSDEPWYTCQFSLDKIGNSEGSIVLTLPGILWPWKKPGKILVYDLVISEPATLDLERARSFRDLRIRNEQINFDAYYQHAMFQTAPTQPAEAQSPPNLTAQGATSPSNALATAETGCATPVIETPPPPVPSALKYSRTHLAEKIKLDPPPFGWRLRKLVEAYRAERQPGDVSKFKVLSICSGAARIEADMVRHLPHEAVSLTLLDVNGNLLELARRSLESWGPVATMVSDINSLDLQGEKFNVVICVSALHHVVELEHVLAEVANALAENGEFWSIGETLGRNGGRMWPKAYEVANAWFSGLDDKYRLNRVTGVVDSSLPDLDYSIGCYEGIRCESIEPALLSCMKPLHVTKHNCIVHKLFSPSYSDNYDMLLERDRALVESAVDLEVELQAQGTLATELNGIYVRRC